MHELTIMSNDCQIRQAWVSRLHSYRTVLVPAYNFPVAK